MKSGAISRSNSSKVQDIAMASLRRVRVGSRKSQLALVQTNIVVDALKVLHPEVQIEIVTMMTVGDHILDKPLSKIGEKSLFTKELEIALAAGSVDLVVHSLKDLPTTLPEGFAIGAICEREDPSDAVVIRADLKASGLSNLESLPTGSVVGTSSLRRIAQLKRAYPHLNFENVRGNLNSRFRKLDDKDGQYDALILATSGILRMGWDDRISERLSPNICMHAIGQGALAIEIRAGDTATLRLISSLNHRDTFLCCIAERAFLKALEGGCSVPIAACSEVSNNEVFLMGGVYSLDGSDCQIAKHRIAQTEDKENNFLNETESKFDDSFLLNHPIICGIQTISEIKLDIVKKAERTGIELAEILIARGAAEILAEARRQNDGGS